MWALAFVALFIFAMVCIEIYTILKVKDEDDE